MATKTLGTGGDYATFTAAIAGIATWDTLNALDAGVYTEAAALTISGGIITGVTATGPTTFV
jgi:hypothetical protein